uniref:hypothetical protein n=1 Tax=Bacillus sp. OTU530 TaxID=3043862 RepID=UPI00313A76D5
MERLYAAPIILNDLADTMLPLAQYVFQSEFDRDYNLVFASYLLALSPMVIVYIFVQK